MIKQTLQQIAEIVDGEVLFPEFSDVMISGVTYDSRQVNEGNLYIPFLGERVNGHSFIEDAFRKGAVASFYEESEPAPEKPLPLIRVVDSVFALQALATWYLKTLACKVVAITGNNGKTTTKDITAALLGYKYKTTKTQGNKNSEIGLPYTVLHLPEDTEIAVLEMGTERLGELDTLTKIARPDVAILLNVGDSHLDYLIHLDNAATAKLEIVSNMHEDGIAFYNGDDEYILKHLHDDVRIPTMASFGTNKELDHPFKLLSMTEEGLTLSLDGEEFTLQALGEHNAYNFAAAILTAQHFGLSDDEIREAVSGVDFTKQRQDLKHLDGFSVLDDSYKSNTASLTAALKTLLALPHRHKIVALADFLGAGETEIDKHISMKEYLRPDTVDYVFTTGPLMKHLHETIVGDFAPGHVMHFDDRQEMIEHVTGAVEKGSLVLVKGSRDFHMEDIVEALEKQSITL